MVINLKTKGFRYPVPLVLDPPSLARRRTTHAFLYALPALISIHPSNDPRDGYESLSRPQLHANCTQSTQSLR